MPNPLHLKLDRLRRDLLRLADLADEALSRACAALLDGDATAADSLPGGDGPLDDLEDDISRQVHSLLSLYQPVSADLRTALAVARLAGELERVGDLACLLATRAKELGGPVPREAAGRLGALAGRVRGMLRCSVEAFAVADAARARRVIAEDAQADAAREDLDAWLRDQMRADPEFVGPGLALFSAVRHLERVGDHATNVAEEALYLAEGDVVRHRRAACPPVRAG